MNVILALCLLGLFTLSLVPPALSSASFNSQGNNSCCLSRVWTATYRWRRINVTGTVFMDYTQELFTTRETPATRQRRRSLNWTMQSTEGRYLHHSSTSRRKRDVAYDRPVTSALELNRCLHGGRLNNRTGEMEFELLDNRLIRGHTHCTPLIHQHTSIRVRVDAATCKPKSIHFMTFGSSNNYTYYLPPPEFILSDVRGYSDHLAVNAAEFLMTRGNRNNGSACPPSSSMAYDQIENSIRARRRAMGVVE